MRKMKDSGIEWIGEIPEEWESIKGKIVLRNDKQIAGGRADNYQRLALTMHGVLKRSKEDVDGLQPTNFESYQIVRKDNLIFKLIDLQNIRTSRVGLSPYDGLVSPAYIVMSIDKKMANPKFLYYYYYFLWKDNIFNIIGSSGVRSNLNVTDMLNLRIILPSLQEQQEIADFLDEKCVEIDALTSTIKSQIETLEQYKKSVISEAVTKGLDSNAEMKDSGVEWIGEIPETWELSRGKHLFALRQSRGNKQNLEVLSPTQSYGVIPQKKYQELTGMSPVKLKNGIDLNSLKTIHKGDYCISLRSFQGGFEYSEYEGVVSPAYQVFYPIVSVVRRYYKYLFKSLSFIEKMNSYTTDLRDGRNIHFSDFGKTYIPFPAVKEQQQIADFLDEKCEKIDAIIATEKEQLEVLAEYKKSLIYEYVTGKREVA